MDKAQLGKLMINIGTGAIILAVLAAGYFVFIAKDQTPSTTSQGSATVSAEGQAIESAAVGQDIARTITELKDLNKAVALSVDFFNNPAFKQLNDLTVTVTPEPIGRENPFAPTDWKLKEQSLEAAAAKSASGGGSAAPTQSLTQTTSVAPVAPTAPTPPQGI